jgi:hypothetical protein
MRYVFTARAFFRSNAFQVLLSASLRFGYGYGYGYGYERAYFTYKGSVLQINDRNTTPAASSFASSKRKKFLVFFVHLCVGSNISDKTRVF